MKHLTIGEYGSFLGLEANRLAVKNGEQKRYYPLNRLATISIAKRGMAISSDLIEVLSARGIKVFFLDFRKVPYAAILGQSQHGVVAVRQAQQQYCQSKSTVLARQIIGGKVKNQRAVLNHLNKYHQHSALVKASNTLHDHTAKIANCHSNEQLMGFEGNSASLYFQALRETMLFSTSFRRREGRGSQEINNAMLNLGYAILSSYILSAVVNAGLEPYLGVVHSRRPGRMALVLDIMEEYRAWVVDRAVVKLRQQSAGKSELDFRLKKNLIGEIQNTMSKKYIYRKRKIKLEHIIQRQVYRLCGQFYNEKKYQPYLFKW